MSRYILVLILFFISKVGHAQTGESENIANVSRVENIINLYHQSTGYQSPLYNGVRHEGYRFDIRGHAYFETKEWRDGSVFYEGILYKNIPMLYDEVKDELIIHNVEKNAAISLVSDRIKSFIGLCI